MRKALLILFVFLLSSFSAYALEISVGPTYQDLDFSGKIQSNGTRIDLEDDLGISDDEPMGANIKIDGGRHHLYLDLASIKISGAQTLSRTIQFQNKTYSVSTFVSTEVEYNLYETQYHYDLLDIGGENLGFSLAPLLKVSVYDLSLNIKGGGNDETYSELLPIPTVGAIAQANATKYLSILAQASAVGYSGDNYIEYKSVLRIKPLKYVNLDIGYKGATVDYSHNSDILDLDIKGPFFQGSFVYKF